MVIQQCGYSNCVEFYPEQEYVNPLQLYSYSVLIDTNQRLFSVTIISHQQWNTIWLKTLIIRVRL